MTGTTPTDNSLAIRTERHAMDPPSMSLERLQFFAIVGILSPYTSAANRVQRLCPGDVASQRHE